MRGSGSTGNAKKQINRWKLRVKQNIIQYRRTFQDKQIQQMIFGIEKQLKEKPALKGDDGSVFTYGDLIADSGDFKSALGKKRCLVFCLCRNVPEAVCGYIGALEHGSVILMLGETTPEERVKELESTYSPSYYWKPLVESEKADFILGSYGLYPTGLEPPEMADDLALLLSTSGSTGSPKLIRLSKKNLESNAAAIAGYLELSADERPVTTLPLQYTFGLSVINSHLYAGACVLMTEQSFVQQGFWDYLSENGGTSIAGVPYTYEILKRMRFHMREDIGSIRTMIQAGGHLPAELQEFYGAWAQKTGRRFYVMYGQTEATARMSYLPYDQVLSKIGTIGKAIPGGRFELRDAEENVITGANEVGELVYYGDNVSLGYAVCAGDLKKEDERKGCLHTGDMALRDEDGYYVIKGRMARFVKLFGVRVGLDECEDILKGFDEEAIFACTGNDDRLQIFTDSKNWREAGDWLAGKLSLAPSGFTAVYLSKIPVTESGKKDYKKLDSPHPFALGSLEKDKALTKRLTELTEFHMEKCPEYKGMIEALGFAPENAEHYKDLPFIPVGLFKEMTLSSVGDEGDLRTLTSSGTSGQKRSRIVLDGKTRSAQQKALAEIGVSFLGTERLPMLVIDCEDTVRNSLSFSARTAGILGFSIFGRNRTFALKNDMSPDFEKIDEFLEKYGDRKFFVFGFTYIIWLYLCEELEKRGETKNMENAVLVHGGGWKKLADRNISKEAFKAKLKDVCGITDIHDYYGMAEQTGSIFMECSCGHLHASDYSGILIRRPEDFSLCEKGEEGLIQVLSTLPESYPGHSLLTEDLGTLLGEDDCPCGRRGAYFGVSGRVKEAEIRGCSDTYESI